MGGGDADSSAAGGGRAVPPEEAAAAVVPPALLCDADAGAAEEQAPCSVTPEHCAGLEKTRFAMARSAPPDATAAGSQKQAAALKAEKTAQHSLEAGSSAHSANREASSAAHSDEDGEPPGGAGLPPAGGAGRS